MLVTGLSHIPLVKGRVMVAVLGDWGTRAFFLHWEILGGGGVGVVIWSSTSLQHHFQILHCHVFLSSNLILLVPIVGSLGFEHGNLEYVTNTSWSTRTHCASLERLQLLPLVVERRGNLCKVWGRTRFPVPAVRAPGPGGSSWDRVGATLSQGMSTALAPSPCCVRARPGEGREHWETVAWQGQREAILPTGWVCVSGTSVSMHTHRYSRCWYATGEGGWRTGQYTIEMGYHFS